MSAENKYSEKSSYWNWLQKTEPHEKKLKWCHRTDAFALRSIISNGCIIPKKCNIFQEDLIYLFYGRPAYRSNESEQVRLTAKSPVIIIFKNAIEDSGVRLFPFDSGAFDSRYDKWRHTDMDLSGFHMPCGKNAPEKHVSEFFKTCQNYLAMQANKPERKYEGEFEVETITEILTDSSSDNADDRRLAIELQVNRNLNLNSSDTTAIIIPESISQAEWIKEWSENSGKSILIKTYQTKPLFNAGNYQALLEDICNELVYED